VTQHPIFRNEKLAFWQSFSGSIQPDCRSTAYASSFLCKTMPCVTDAPVPALLVLCGRCLSQSATKARE
jgi:hypothetical protein